MASPISYGSVMLCFCIVFFFLAACSDAQVEESRLEAAFEWPTATMASLYEAMDEDEEDGDGAFARRSLFWRTMHYYISYGALSANRIPCPPRSGRSYYTHDCFKARGPAHPYTRGCSRITRCRR